MILKEADDKSKSIHDLESLLPLASDKDKKRIEAELRNIKAGIKGEKDAAYLIDFNLAKSRNTVVIHDLRLEVDGRVAQIDHLLIHRTLTIYALETKSFHAGIKITDSGEFMRWNDFKKTYEGMPSPLSQNERHIAVLADAFKAIEMPTRLGVRMTPSFFSFVLVSPNARVDRSKVFDSSSVIKADLIGKALDDSLDKNASLLKIVSAETLEEFSRKLLALHRPIAFDYAGKFGIGLPITPSGTEKPPVLPAESAPPMTEADKQETGEPQKKKCICATCQQPIPFAVAKFCWNNKRRFGGNAYCMEHQKAF